ncbi:hypothetical protein Tco_0171709, partial [Tanacetum coccineum]
MHTYKDDYLINTLRFVSAKGETQIYGDILPESLTSPEIKETKAYKTYLGFATGATPPKKARKFKKPASPKRTIVPVSTKEPTRKSKRVKRPANKSTKATARDETKITDKVEGDKDEEMDYTTSQLYDDVDIRKTEVPVTSSSHSSVLAVKFLNFLDIPHTDAKI